MMIKTCWEEEVLLLLTSKQTNYILFSHVFNSLRDESATNVFEWCERSLLSRKEA